MQPVPPKIVELEFWTVPGDAATPLDGKEVAERCRRETGLGPSVVLGLSFVPDAVDAQNLGTALALGEVQHEEFAAFCMERAIEPDPGDERAAAEFLAFAQGQALAWLHLPAEREGLEIARALVAWAHAHDFVLCKSAVGTCNALSEQEIYALWQ